ncbi:MAG: NAD(P)/FAD-dependent oxidoreductase [Firmicutes bacterium]|nr:NAD(P)/FAD-dependent oxidoreductase [Bacillota bacterium]
MPQLIVIGGGPAGAMAALTAADAGAAVELWERNRSLGRKLAITGKGRCNVTNETEPAELVRHLPGNGQFLYGAFSRFGAADVMDFFQTRCGLPLKTERGRRVFPASDRARDVVEALERQLAAAGVRVRCQTRAKKLAIEQGSLRGVYDFSGAFHPAAAVVVATGGVTYPATGSTGDGYALAEQAGHSIVPPQPSLVPLETAETWPARVSGLSLKNVSLKVLDGGKVLDEAFGEMLFTHFGVSGPLVLTLSKTVCAHPEQGRGLTLSLDLKPALTGEQLRERLRRDLEKYSRRQFANSLGNLLPASLIPVFVELSGVSGEKPVNQLTRQERSAIVSLLKDLPLTVTGPRPLAEAIVTAGGVSVRQVDPRSMGSRLLPGLFFAGEVLDVDGWTGGYNLQAAWSSGYAAGCGAAAWCQKQGDFCAK